MAKGACVGLILLYHIGRVICTRTNYNTTMIDPSEGSRWHSWRSRPQPTQHHAFRR